MSTPKRYYWIKLRESFMSSDTVDFLMSQKGGADYVVLYQLLCLKTINTGGRLSRTIGEIVIPYDVDKIQRDCKWFSADTIRVALNLYKRFGLIYEECDGTLVLAEHDNLVGSETNWAAQKRSQQKAQAPKLGTCKRLNRETLLLPSGEKQYVDEKRYGGNGMKAFDLANGVCEICGCQENLCIHHGNGYSNEIDDLYILCRGCHSKVHSGAIEQFHNHSTQRGGNEVERGVEIFHPDIRDKDIRDQRLDTRYKDIEKDDGGINPYGDVNQQRPDFNTLEVYASSNLRYMSKNNLDELISFRDSLPDDVIRNAIDEACANGSPNYGYVRGILNRYVDRGFKTLGDIKAYEAQRRQNLQGKKNSEIDYSNEDESDPFKGW